MSTNEVEVVYELSPMQQAMLFASLYAPGSGVYVIQLNLRLTGRLDLAAFERAWRRVVERHAILRTGFHWEDLDVPLQVVFEQVGLELRRESWRGLGPDEQEERLREFLDADRGSGFELIEPPLMRLALFELDTDVWHLVWTLHHLLVDGWSVRLLLKELLTCYTAFAAGQEPALPPARSYGDYIEWLQRQDMAEAEAFWRESLAGLTAPTLLAGTAGGDGRPASDRPAGFRQPGRRSVRLGPEVTAPLRELARAHRLTLNTLVQGAWALVLAQATGNGDVVFGGTVAGRPAGLPGVESMIGLFINTLPVRAEVAPERPLLPWLEELQAGQVEAWRFDHAPLHEIQTWSGLPAGTPLFDNILVFESFALDSSFAELLQGLAISRTVVDESNDYPLTLAVYPGPELALDLLHDIRRIDEPAAVRLLERLSGVLRAFAADPEVRLQDVPLLLPGERQQVLVEHNDTASAYPREACLPELFAAVAREAPDAPALVSAAGEVWSYGRLAAAAGALARHLRGLGVQPETRVGVCMERSPELIVSVLAVLAAGGAYAPLDAGYPDERLAFMLADLSDRGAPLVLVDAGTKPRLEGMAPLLTVEEGLWSPDAEPAGPEVPAESLALVIYTSGSTGRPKGVALTHRGIVRMVRGTTYARWDRRDRVAHLSNISFDAATMEIWSALLNGAALVIIPRDEALSPARLGDRIRRDGVTWMVLTTALFNQIAREEPEALAPLRAVMFAGEAADPSAVARMLGGDGPELLNGYGPAEGATISTWHRVREIPPDAVTVPIGLPVANTSVYVLDRRQDLVPPGVVGELCIGGDGLARGYLNRPDLTAERFVPHPWGAGERLYRTGDLVRRSPSGPIEFIGRVDSQVKIRGFRIEPGEIEAVLAAQPEVAACAVVVRRDAPDVVRLVAYVVLHRTDPTDPTDDLTHRRSELTAWLRDRLPQFMLPSAFVFLDVLPLTPNGKVDRNALPSPEQAPGGDEEYAPPADPIEELLAGVWADVLGRERVGVHDDFFALGGHSLLATQVVSRIRGVLGVELPLRSLFEAPTAAGLARAVREGLAAQGPQAPPLVPIPRDASAGDLPLSFAQQRLWFIDRLEPGNPGYNIPAAVRLLGDLSVPRLARVFAEVVRRHEVLRTTFSARDGRPLQVIHPEPLNAELPVVDLADLPPPPDIAREALARRLAREESLRPFDLEAGPLLRVTLLRLDGREHLLFFTLHHIVSDGWSMGVLVREVEALYRGVSLPELPIQYADFAAWQRQWLAGEVLERQLAWWREHLAGTSGVLELPTDHPRPAVLSLRGAEHRFALDALEGDLSRRLAELGRREGVTPFMILAAALFALLSRLSGQRDLNLGSPIANRNRIETEGLIGFFVNTLVLRARVGREASYLDLLLQVREASLGAYAHQDLPFEKLVDEVQPERDLSRSPLVQVALAVNNAPLSQAELEGLRLVPETPPAAVAKFDLAFIFGETGEGRLAGSLEYATDLLDATTAVRLTRQLVTLLGELTAGPEQPLADLPLLTREERHQVLFEWNDTAETVRSGVLLHQPFEERVDEQPEALAAVHESGAWSYRELEARANRLANFLTGLVDRRSPVGVWMERSLPMLASVLGILKAGGTYVPLDAAWPADRVETILAGTGAPAIVVDRATLPAVEKIRWRLPRLGDTICLDLAAPEPGPERVDTESVRSLFDFVAERATDRDDRVTAGGFVHRDTGLPFSEAEVDEYRDRVLSLASPWLRPDARVLEVGSGSGLILWEMAQRVERCVGLDPSERTQERNREHAREQGIANVELPVGFAHEIGERFAPGSFDLVVLASTVQFFPGPRYLEAVVAAALRLLAPGGALLVADVIDARIEPDTDRLALDEELFHDLGQAEIHHRDDGRGGFANELGERYDVILRPGLMETTSRRKRTWTGWHVERASSVRPAAAASPEDVAYVIHTSGSTGMPKGIAVQHAPAVRLVDWVNRTFGVGPADRLLFITSLCFDLSVYDVFGTLAAGGTVHVASEAALREPGELLRLLREEPVTVWDSAPAALQQLAPLFPHGEERPLRLVMLSGDWIPVPLPDQVRAAFPGTRVISLGGATEATVWSNWYPVGTVDPSWPSIPYGRPIANARYHVLDEALLPCPIGVPGDLYIGGACLCVGYASQPDLTAASFIPDPFAAFFGHPGARLYRTGDRSRSFRDGNLEFLGRVDQQVKIRGYRIELGEIEVALLRHPAVREAVVAVWEDRLVAYAVPREGEELEAQQLRAWLAETLPVYMVPPAYVLLPSLPVTANGKLDRKALPAPEWGGGEGGYEAPSDPVEETLAGLWGELLGLERVGVRESFFTLGGHSLLATQLMSRLREAFGVELQLRELFEAPTIAELAHTVRHARQEGAAAAPPLAARPRDAGSRDLPLSFAQQRLWFIDQLEPGSAAYNIPIAVRVSGELSSELLRRVFAEIVRRHEALRTTFAACDGRPFQVIDPMPHPLAPSPRGRGIMELGIDLPVVDLSQLPAADREARTRVLTRDEMLRPFSLEKGPLLRLTLVRMAGREHLLLLTLHHIIADAWSLGVLLREVATLYKAFAQGLPSPLPELPVQYADFTVWQRSWLQGAALQEQLDRWTRRLAGAPRMLEMPVDRPRPAVPSYRGAMQPFALPPAPYADVRRLCARAGVTPFMALLAAWAALLGRHAGQEDVLVGSPVANRNRRETEDLIGFFVNTLVLRTDLSGAPTFLGLLDRVRTVALEAFSHQDLPFERLVEEMVPERDLALSPLFQAMFVLQNAPVGTLSIPPALTLTPVALESATARFDLLFTLIETGEGGLTGTLEYSTDLFDADRIVRLLQHFTILLAGAAAEPERPVAELPLLTAEERERVLSAGNGTAAAFPRVAVHIPVEEQAERTPEAPAALWTPSTNENETGLTYRELNRQANQLAHHLRALGVGPDERVAVCLERSLAPLIAVLGVLKAGGAYVPIDPDYPAERVGFLLADSKSRVLVTTSALAARLPGLDPEQGARLVLLDAHREDLAARSTQDPACRTGPDHLAYVIYTSGSTGRPKGVAMPHGVLANMLAWQIRSSAAGPGSRTLQFASLSFDVSFQEIFSTWWAGGTVVALPQETRRDAMALCRVLGEQRIERLFLPFVALQQIAEVIAHGAPVPAALTEIFTAGEQLQVTRPIAAWLERSGARLENQYGPSEGHVVTAHRLAGPPAEWPVLPPIGRPIANVRVYLLDRSLEPVPQGVPGQLCFGGAPVVRGYLDRPELTAERFVPDPFGGEPGARLYATGDRAQLLADGSLRFLGRIDQQVKIRGFRVEPGEVESALTRHPAVQAAAVVVQGPDMDRSAERRLVGYYVSAVPLAGGELRDFLAGELPDYMVPALLVRLDALPLTPSGKLDRRALPDPRSLEDAEEASPAAPSDLVEELLAGIWAEILRRKQAGIHDDFFALGGNSLLATQVMSRVRTVLGVELPLRQLFETPTVAGFARAVRAAGWRGAEEAPPIVPVHLLGAPPLSFAQQRLWLIDQLDPGNPAYNVPLAVRLTGELSMEALERTFAEVVRRHAALRTTFAVQAGRPVQVVAPPESISLGLQVLDLSDAPEEARDEWACELAVEESWSPFDLARGPLLRLGLLRLDEREHLLLVTFHHIVADGWSVGVLLREMGLLYPAFLRGEPSPLPELPLQYADFARWQRSWLQGEVLERQLAYWTQELADAPQMLELPTDRRRPATPTFHGASVDLTLPPALRAAVQELCARHQATPFMLLLAAWALLLGRHAGQDDLLVGTPVAGRNRREIEDLIGFFVNTLVIRTELSGAPTFNQLLGRVRETVLDALAHQELPFERLVEELAPERDPSRSPLFQVSFLLQNAPAGELALPGLTLSRLGSISRVAKFDLTLSLAEREGGFAGALEHNTDLFDGSTALRLLVRFQALLEGIVTDPGRPVADLPLLLPAERHQTLVEPNEARDGGLVAANVLGRFLEQAAGAPEAPAVILAGTGEVLSYGELDRQSAFWARWLHGLGAGPEVRVGICVRRTPRMVVGLLAVLRAGGAYVPLDPTWPAERLAWMLDDAGLELILTESETAGLLPEATTRPLRRLLLDQPVGDADLSSPAGLPDPAHPAYVIYTSGSTGRPKGVVAIHSGLAAFSAALAEVMALGPSDRVLQSASLSFDASAVAIWPTLLRGAAVVLHPDPATLSARELLALCAALKLTVLELPAALWRQVVKEMDGAGLRFGPSVRLFMTGGESLAPEVLRQWGHIVAPEARLVSSYGPTEATVIATIFEAGGREAASSTLTGAPLGVPLPGTGVYLLDAGLSPVPMDVAGEIFLGGVGVTRGYLGRPDLTAAVFIPDPWGPPGARLYRTGDRARRRPHPETKLGLEFLGRIDDQVKLRGFRIEPGEIEAVLRSHPAVAEAVVQVRDERLAAWVVLDPVVLNSQAKIENPESTLAAWLREKLPEHMVPSAFVALPALPLTPTGKVDRKALPAPEHRADAAGYVAPEDPVEERMVEVWREILGLGRVGVQDNFFAVGGNSLLATQLASRLREALGVELPVRRVFEAPTIRQLSRILRDTEGYRMPDLLEGSLQTVQWE